MQVSASARQRVSTRPRFTRRASGLYAPEEELHLGPPPPPPPPPRPFPFAFWRSGSFDPATQNLTGWWRAGNFAANKWSGQASLGTSGSHHLDTSSPNFPTSGAALNGFATVRFQAALSQGLTLSAVTFPASVFLSTTRYSGWALYNPASISTDFSGANVFKNQAVARVGGQWWVQGMRSTGPAATMTNDDVGSVQASGIGINAWHLVMFRYDGVNMGLKVDSNPWQNAASAAITTLGGGWVVGENGVTFYDGLMAELATSQLFFDDATFDKIRTGYINTRYGLAL